MASSGAVSDCNQIISSSLIGMNATFIINNKNNKNYNFIDTLDVI